MTMLSPAMYVAILVGAVLIMVFGMLRYSPVLFGKRWAQAMNYDKSNIQDKQRSAKIGYAITFVGWIITGFFVANLVDYLNIIRFSEIAELSFWLWIAFIVPTMLGGVVREDKKRLVFTIGAVYQLISLVIMMSTIVFWF